MKKRAFLQVFLMKMFGIRKKLVYLHLIIEGL